MNASYIQGDTLDDVMRVAIENVEKHGQSNDPSKGDTKELTGVLLELTNPRARLSRTETRGKPFSCLGELCWYLAGSNEEEFISYYIPTYKKYAEDGSLFGGYGPRMFGESHSGQVGTIINLLKQNPPTRRAVIQLFDAEDILERHEDVPCTCTLQFLIRKNALHMVTYMRSNDAYLGLPHDIFSFTMLQEILANTLAVELGVYKHAVGSLHIYDRDKRAVEQFLDEGWQSTDKSMPPMPKGNPWPAIRTLLDAESRIRRGETVDESERGETVDESELEVIDPYWADLIRLLQIFSMF